jgi:hypothetical protein
LAQDDGGYLTDAARRAILDLIDAADTAASVVTQQRVAGLQPANDPPAGVAGQPPPRRRGSARLNEEFIDAYY